MRFNELKTHFRGFLAPRFVATLSHIMEPSTPKLHYIVLVYICVWRVGGRQKLIDSVRVCVGGSQLNAHSRFIRRCYLVCAPRTSILIMRFICVAPIYATRYFVYAHSRPPMTRALYTSRYLSVARKQVRECAGAKTIHCLAAQSIRADLHLSPLGRTNCCVR